MTVLKQIGGIALYTMAAVCAVPAGLVPIETFQVHISQYLENFYMYATQSEEYGTYQF